MMNSRQDDFKLRKRSKPRLNQRQEPEANEEQRLIRPDFSNPRKIR